MLPGVAKLAGELGFGGLEKVKKGLAWEPWKAGAKGAGRGCPDSANGYNGSVTTTALDSIPNRATTTTSSDQKRVLLLKPRGFCAGVVRAIDIVKIALETFGAPIYVRREIVHNRYVVNELAEKGAIFVHEIDDVPDGQRVIYSAHGVSPAVRERSKGRGLKVIDATCPLVTKVHIEAVKFAKQGYSLVLIGHRDHDEIEGTLGEAPDVTQVVSSAAEVATLEVPDPNRVAYLTQTTLSLDEARDIIHALKAEVSEHRWSALAGHLLCDGKPAGGGPERGAQRRSCAGGRVDEQFQLQPAGRGFPEPGDNWVSD